jgi:putative membrane protein
MNLLVDVAPVVPPAVLGLAYRDGVARLRARGDAWPRARVVAAAAGLLAAVAAVVPPVSSHDERFPVHVVQHLLLGMLAPLLLALAAPVTLALRVARPASRARLLRVLHSRPAQLLGAAPTVLVLDVGGLFALYLTPLYALTGRSAAVHLLAHLHVVASGALLSWLVLGVDPGPRRRSTPWRLGVLVLAGTGHGVLAKILYAHGLPAGAQGDRALGAQLLYYGGGLVEVLLAVAVMARWYAASGRAAARAARRPVAADG